MRHCRAWTILVLRCSTGWTSGRAPERRPDSAAGSCPDPPIPRCSTSPGTITSALLATLVSWRRPRRRRDAGAPDRPDRAW
uniref:MYXO-CTERM sorting domain-containing protein n=1 Tax=Actinoalloteichus hoggarensis TaxID=1470176 RepID=UPI0035DB6DEA